MIKSFQHKGLEVFFRKGAKSGIQPHHAVKLRVQLTALDNARLPKDINVPSWKLHQLTGDMSGFWSITVNGNWRMIFRFVEQDVELVNYLDYH